MLKHTASLRLFFGVCLLSCLAAVGCKEKPELSFSDYGETIDHLPVIEDLPNAFPVDWEMEPKECSIRNEVRRLTRSSLYISQGREVELAQAVKAEEEEERLKRAQMTTNSVEEPVVEDTVVEEPAVEETVEEPTVEEPTVEETTAEEPTAEEPAVEETVTEEPAVEEPAVEETVAEEPTVEEPTAEEPTVEETAAEEPTE
ncbi:MAG: hypothetical protein PHO46_04435 [Thermoguttaceae bacterium]|jgi:hypothetical protein|nr:hypothetical protein [Thermoguttaceae bacterium]